MVQLLFVFILLFAPSHLMSQDDAFQVIDEMCLKDLGYGFVLNAPDKGWRFIKEKEVKAFTPDACAGLFSKDTRYCTVVIVEEVPGVALPDYAGLLIDYCPLEKKQVLNEKEFDAEQGPAYRYQMKGEMQGMDLMYRITLYRNGSFICQVCSWWLRTYGDEVPSSIASIHDSFGFLPDVKPQSRVEKLKSNMQGVGWRVKDDLYENALFGFKMALPSNDWAFMDDVELKNVNPEACCGMRNNSMGIYLIVLAEDLTGIEPEMYDSLVIDDFKQLNHVEKESTKTVQLCMKEHTQYIFHEAMVGNTKMDFVYLMPKREGLGFQIIAWWFHREGDENVSAMSGIYDRFDWIEEEGRQRLLGELEDLSASNRSIGVDDCFLNHRYCNFPFGLSIQFPKGFWMHSIGMEARAENEEVSLFAEEVQKGLNVTLIIEQSLDFTPETYHEAVLAMYDPPEEVVTRKLKAHGNEITCTRFINDHYGQPISFNCATAGNNNKYFQVLFSTNRIQDESIEKLELDILEGVVMGPDPVMEKEQLAENIFLDRRFGFRVVLDRKDWKFEDITPQQLKGLGSLVLISNQDKSKGFCAGALHTGTDNLEVLSEMIAQNIAENQTDIKRTEQEETTWHGHPAICFTYETTGFFSIFKSSKMWVTTTQISGTLYYFIQMSTVDRNDMKERVRFET